MTRFEESDDGLAGRASRTADAGPAIEVNASLVAFERPITAQIGAAGEDPTYAGALVLYRELAAVNRVVASDRRSVPAAMLEDRP